MKPKGKAAALAVAAMMVFSLAALAACGPNDEELIRNGVAEELDGLKNLEETALAEITEGVDTADFAELGIDMNEFMKAYFGEFDYRIDEVKVDGDKAQVTVAFTCKDFGAYEQALEDAAMEMAGDGSIADLTEEEMSAKVGELVMASLDTVLASEKEPIVLDYELIDNTWTPTESASEAVATALFA